MVTTAGELDLRDAARMSWSSLRRYKLMQAALVAAALLAATAYLVLRPGAYTAMARVLVDNRVLAIAQQDAVYSTSVLTPQLVQSQVEILRSEALAQQVIDRLGLIQSDEFGSTSGLTEQQSRRQGLDRFKRRLSVEVVPQSHVVEVRYTSRDPQRAANVANTLIEAYLQDQSTANGAAAKASSGWLRGNMRALGTSGRVLGSAMAPLGRDGPTAPVVLAFALFCGVFAAAAAALARGFLDGRLRSARDIHLATGRTALAEIPLAPLNLGARRLLTRASEKPKSQFAHGIARVATALRHDTARGDTARGRTPVVGVAAQGPGGGATLVSANVARTAAQSGSRVLLIDASYFSGTLTALAEDNDRLDSALLVDTWSGLHFASVLSSPRPSRALAALVDQHRRDFDVIVVDLPAIEASPDFGEMLPHLDSLVLVIAEGTCARDDLQEGLATHPRLRDKLIGIVLNKAAPPAARGAAPFYRDERFTVETPPLAFVPAPSRAATHAQDDGATDGQAQPPEFRGSRPGRTSVHSTAVALVVALLSGLLFVSARPALADAYRLASGDTVRVKVSEWPDLTGDYTLGAGGSLSLPVIGTIEADGLTVPEVAANVSRALQKRGDLQDLPAASISIVTYRPFFVMGDVQKPGEYAYRPGLTVLQAISVAGGYYRPLDISFRLERDAIAARGDIAHETSAMQRVAARIARLEAERDDRDEVAVPAGFDTTPGSPDAGLHAEEQTMLRANKEALAKLLASLDHYKDLYEQEITTVTAQIATERQQADAVQRELDSLKGLAERGLSPLTRQLTTERTLAQISGTIQGLYATILRARQNIGLTEQRRLEALNARTSRINEGLQKARADEKDAAQRLRAARALLQEAQVIAPGLQAAAQLVGVTPTFTILRRKDDSTEELAAAPGAQVLPGDVLTVERRPLQPQATRETGRKSAHAGPMPPSGDGAR